jgi:tartrate dehydratase beta subunit/fumarate hydratase class I family protein
LATVCDNALTRIAQGISVGMPGPRDLTVRIVLFVGARTNPRCSTDTPTASRLNVRDDREAPLLSRRDARKISFISVKKKY